MPLRNSLHRRNHKERSQLAHRSRLGVLEKHKDYVQRARDYHSKQDRLNRLKQKVNERNKDEFYFSMTKQATKGGVHIADRGNVALPQDTVKLLKTQDENYVRTMRAAGLKKVDKIKNQLMSMADLLKPGLFDEEEDAADLDPDELEILQSAGSFRRQKRRRAKVVRPQNISCSWKMKLKVSRHYASASSSHTSLDEPMPTAASDEEPDLGWKVSKSRRRHTTQDDAVDESMLDEEEHREVARTNRTRLLKELSARLFRDRQLRYAEREFEMQRQLMGKGARQKIAGVEAVDGDDDEEDEDEIDARRGKRKEPKPKFVDPKTYKPRVYKWRLERKK
ncbi:unnamed protein product [Mycena citricolor]|uniref:U3 small nucleolar RNA-associated protein 11 n=1 Tax=Mycena citricolor TaxID=2018698 RepID=A0AAD2HQK7_9AGAR|nr:unnamed protein product [Mycena citricolor]